MTQEAPNYVEYRPPADGVAPPNWRDGMDSWYINRRVPAIEQTVSKPAWFAVDTYLVPPEALTAPNEDAPIRLESGKSYNQLSVALSILRAHSAETLARYGITLEPPKDWATELWADLWEVRGCYGKADDTRNGRLAAGDQAAIALIRERVVLKERV